MPPDAFDKSCPLPDLAAKASALAHPARLQILAHLSGQGACCCKEIVGKLDLAQSTVSQHLKVLVESGLVRYSPERQRSRYTVNADEVSALSSAMAGYLGACATRAADNCCGD